MVEGVAKILRKQEKVRLRKRAEKGRERDRKRERK